MPKCGVHGIELVSFCPTCRRNIASKERSETSRTTGKLYGGRRRKDGKPTRTQARKMRRKPR